MKKHFRFVVAIIVVALSALGCGTSQPSAIEPPSSGDQVATVVASTMQALTPDSPDSPTSQPTGLFPHSLYFINNDNTGIAQVFRLETDGKTTSQITFEPAAVNSYDVSQVDGSVAYVSNNQLLLINADGSDRRALVDGGPVDPSYQFAEGINSPTFSPDGQTIAFGHLGLVLYGVSTGISNRVLENQPGEMYVPQMYSPDGTKILITIAIPNSDGVSSGIYYPAAASVVPVIGADGVAVCCSEQGWAWDSSSLYAGLASVGMFGSGLWRADASSGDMVTLLPTETSGNYNLASHPYLAPDGQLYFFFVNLPATEEFVSRAPLQIVRAAPDGVTGRTVLLPETFQLMNEALWAPDASFVITAIAPSDQIYQGGALELFYTHAEAGMLTLAPFGQQLKWGP
ncbi:MAG: PD40 domain-containing protein [Anaerolineales bacterium]|nr:PD40 domain-containing protein [Anaerolineales bacterium]